MSSVERKQQILPNLFDVVIIGGGPGGYVAAIRASQLGGKVALVEKGKVGGTCLNTGCIPVNALLKSARAIYAFRRAEEFGIFAKDVRIDFETMKKKTSGIVNKLVLGVEYLLKANNVQVIKGKATITSRGTVEVANENGSKATVKAKKIIVATGAKCRKPLVAGASEKEIITTDDALQLKEIPKSLLIMGGNPEAMAFAAIFNALGTKVTVTEPTSHVLLSMDIEIAILLQRLLKKDGVDVFTNAEINKIETSQTEKTATITTEGKEKRVSVEKILSTDRMLNTGDLGLDKIGVTIQNGKVSVDDRMETNIHGIYAVGDVTGESTAHVAFAEGMIAAENAMGKESTIDRNAVPKCAYTITDVASVGLTEKQARERNNNVKIGRFPFSANGKALILGESEGLVKIVADEETGEILGVYIIGPNATEMIAEAVLAIKLEATIDDLADAIHVHPTLSETLKEAALDANDSPIHMPRRKG